MPTQTTYQVMLQGGIRLTVLIMIAGIAYFFLFKPTAVAEGKAYLGDPRTACAYPADAVQGTTIQYAAETGVPPSWDEIPDESQVKSIGYQKCK